LEARHADDLDAVITELATHWAEASAGGDPTRAIELAMRAGELAFDRGALENALRWFERALDLLEDDALSSDQRRRTLIRVAELQVLTGAGAEGRANAIAAARAAIAVGDAETAALAAGVSARMSFDSSDPPDPERTATLRAVLELDLDDAQRARVLGELATELIFERDIAGRADALALWRSIVDGFPAVERAHVSGPGTTSYRDGWSDLVEHLRRTTEAVELAATPTERLRGEVGTWFVAGRLGDRSTMDEMSARIRRDREGLGMFASFSLVPQVMALTLDGRLAEAAELRRTMTEGLEALNAPEATVYAATTGMALDRERGTVADLMILIELLESLGHPAGAARAMAAFIRLANGDTDRVMTALQEIEHEPLSDDAGLPVVLALWSEIAATVRAAEPCRRFIGEIAPLAGVQLATGGIHFGSADRLLARLQDALGEHDVADRHFASAVEQHEALRSPPWIARTRLDWAESLLTRGRRDEADSHLDAAEAAIGDLDLPDNQQRLDALRARR
jgi:tetratricopeptide (TPR) repeat protein